MQLSRKQLESELVASGLRLLGGWLANADDALAALPGGPVAVVWMVSQVGSACWPAFSVSGFREDGLPDPMDRWSKSIGDALADAAGGIAVYPSDGPPYAPFQRWAARAAPLHQSPLMLQIHPRYGLWHACRFALMLPWIDASDRDALQVQDTAVPADLCLSCDGRPCLQACPVQAFAAGGYDVAACAGHLHGRGGEDCMQHGCLARRACPVAPELRYQAPHAVFHMRAFAGRH